MSRRLPKIGNPFSQKRKVKGERSDSPRHVDCQTQSQK